MRGRLLILYGSQTGTAEDLAIRISHEARRLLYDCIVEGMDQFGATSLIDERLVLFVTATTGQGDAPDNMTAFWRFLRRKSLPANSLSALQFGVIGLGDSSYSKFNFVAKKLQRRLEQLGASALAAAALADDQHDLGADAVVDPWLDRFWQQVDSILPLPPGAEPLSVSVCPASRYTVSPIVDIGLDRVEPPQLDRGQLLAEGEFWGRLVSNERVTPESHFQQVRLLQFSLPDEEQCKYSPGDVVTVFPENLAEEVEEFLGLLSVDPDVLTRISGPTACRAPVTCTVRWLARYLLDIHSVPRRSFFKFLAYFSASELEKEKFEEMSSAEGQQELYDYCNRPRRTVLEVLADFPSTARRVPVQYLLEMIPAIRPRSFSIASSSKVRERCLEILVAVVAYRSKLVRPRIGLCSTWLSRLELNRTVPMKIKSGTIRFPLKAGVPVLMVGPGTGVAPFRSYIQEQTMPDTPARPLVLFFGCRSQQADFFFADKWQRLESSGKLQLFTAFSRDQQHKCYVQHRIEEQSALVWRLLDKSGGAIYVAGSARQMPDDVQMALRGVVMSQSGCSEHQAQQYLHKLEQEGRLQLETWS